MLLAAFPLREGIFNMLLQKKTLMKKLALFPLLFLFLIHISAQGQQKAKYIFFMIGDGMGLNQINLTEVYLAAQADRNTVFPLAFSNFPFATFATSYSLSHGVTDSAAGGTALAVGKKTKNGVIGMDSAGTKAYSSIAYAAQAKGLKVGITTNVSIDHATPASFYAHQPDRDWYYEIGQDLIKSNFDFFAGSGFLKPTTSADKKDVPALYPQFEKAGYTLLYGLDDFKKRSTKARKVILMNNKGTDASALKFAIDREANDLNLKDITMAAVESLSKDNEKGFFLMVEGGKIDWAAHANDAATTIKEVLDFNASVQVALDFYKKYPEETLIIVTADHETGGIAIGNGSSKLNTKVLGSQQVSQGVLSSKVSALRAQNPNATWDDVKSLLKENLGLWSAHTVSKSEEEALFQAYEKSFVNHQQETAKSLYAKDEKIAALAVAALNRIGSIAWASGNHSAAYIPVFAIGAGASLFSHKMENTDIPKKVAEAAGLSL